MRIICLAYKDVIQIHEDAILDSGYLIDAEDDEQELVILKLAAGETSLDVFTEWVKSKVSAWF